MLVFAFILVVVVAIFLFIDDYLFYMATGLCSLFTASAIIVLLACSGFNDYKKLKKEEKENGYKQSHIWR